MLHYIVILHQTTTYLVQKRIYLKLHYIVILHQTTTWRRSIRPRRELHYIVILHQTTTYCMVSDLYSMLHYIVILHQTTTINMEISLYQGCIISLFYIKPQLVYYDIIIQFVALYRYSTSNHNFWTISYDVIKLHYIVILHQTTTMSVMPIFFKCCIISLFYIKPQQILLSTL